VTVGTPLLRRAWMAINRVLNLIFLLIIKRHIKTVFVFGGYDLTSFAEKGLMIILSKLFGKRTVFSVRTEIRPYSYDRWFVTFRRWVVKHCDVIICQSQIAAASLSAQTGCAPEKICVLMNWVFADRYVKPAPTLDDPDDEAHVFTYIFVGHLTENKAPDVLIESAKLLRSRGINFRLVLCGNGPLYEQLQEAILKAQMLSVVELRGWVVGDELLKAMWNADVFVLPTYSEGMPNALLEAMAAGMPVISTPVSAIPEIVTEGENGLLVPPGNAVALADAMEKLFRQPELRQMMSQHNFERIRLNHTIDGVWRRIADLL